MNAVSAFQSASDGKPKKPAPFSLRLTAVEKTRLLRRAKGRPLGRYIKAQLFSKNGDDLTKADIAKALGGLGASDLARNMARIANASEIGALPVTPELSEQLSHACTDIRFIRFALVRALGLRSK